MALAVHFRDVVSLSGRFPLLSGASIDVADGEIVHLRGPNGAGKTSLLRAFSGLVPIASGEAVVLGHDLREDPRPLRREIGLIGHATFLYDDLSVEANVHFALRAAHQPIDRAHGAMQRLGLEGRLLATQVRKLSAGQRRRCALAILLAKAPRLWLLDEPHAGLDKQGRELVDELITEASAAGVTVVVASHDLERAALLADRVVDVVGGRVELLPEAVSHPPVGQIPEGEVDVR
jgi:heme ABC exporter ATP-binding subunit CcmA